MTEGRERAEAALWELEKRFWLNGADFYEARLDRDAIMVLPYPALLMEREAALASLADGPRWEQVEFSDRSFRRRSDTAILAYRARAWRDHGGEAPYEAICASTYIADEGGEWRLMAHHQQALTVADDATKDA